MEIQEKAPNESLPPITAGIAPEKFSEELAFLKSGRGTALILIVLMMIGFGLRTSELGIESFGEDELNKFQTVEEYRANGLSGKNGEHPFLMKGLQTLSVSAADRWNSAASTPGLHISREASLRFPLALFGTFTILLLFLLVRELFGRSIGFVSAALYAVEPTAIGFDRIAKEDALVLCFFLLANFLWLRSQTRAERGDAKWVRSAYGMCVAFAALMASKYYPHLLAVSCCYYNVYDYVPIRKWRIGHLRWLAFFAVMGFAFLIFNPTILLPDTWHEMLKFGSENRVGHDSMEYMGSLYRNQMSLWFAGMPWTFYYVFIGVKTSLATLLLGLIGLPLMFRRRLGDGRFFIFMWAFFWFLPFTVLGGKFTRYFALAEPLILVAAAVGFYFSMKWLSEKLRLGGTAEAVFQMVAIIMLLGFSLSTSISVGPNYRMFTNMIGGGMTTAGNYFPHDEFYDAATRDIISEVTGIAENGATVACETSTLFEYYAGKAGRNDLKFVSLSDKSKVSELKENDVIVLARGRRYFSNDAYEKFLAGGRPDVEVSLAGVPAAKIYKLDRKTAAGVRAIASQ